MPNTRLVFSVISLCLWTLCLGYFPPVTYSIANGRLRLQTKYKDRKKGTFIFTAKQHIDVSTAHAPYIIRMTKTIDCLSSTLIELFNGGKNGPGRVNTLLEMLALLPICQQKARQEASKLWSDLQETYTRSKTPTDDVNSREWYGQPNELLETPPSDL